MPNSDVATPASSAPTVRLALGVSWVRPGVAGIGGTLNPATQMITVGGGVAQYGMCFEGSEE